MIQKFYIMEVCGNIFQNIKNVLDIVSGPRGKKWLKVIHQFKIVNYFTCCGTSPVAGLDPQKVI